MSHMARWLAARFSSRLSRRENCLHRPGKERPPSDGYDDIGCPPGTLEVTCTQATSGFVQGVYGGIDVHSCIGGEVHLVASTVARDHRTPGWQPEALQHTTEFTHQGADGDLPG
jgi:hypothetical protein